MKTVQANSYGAADVLQVVEVNSPIPQANEILVQIKASSVNPVDWKIRRGDLKLISGWGFPRQFGSDFAGIVTEIGENIQDYQVGDEVYGFTNPLKGGAYAQYLAVNPNIAAPKPSSLSFEQAAAIPLASLTALQSLCDLGQIQLGMKVLVNGASGGVGSFAVQIAKAMNTEVTGVCSSPNMDLVEQLGADRVIDYTQQDFTQENIQYDLIFDAVGKSNFSDCTPCLTNQGIYVTTLPTLKNLIPLLTRWILPGKKAKLISVQPKSKDLKKINELIESSKIQVIIDRVFSLDQIVEAHQYSQTGKAVGKIVVSITEE